MTKNNKTSTIKARVSVDEHAVITEFAEKQSLSLSDFIRQCVVNEISNYDDADVIKYVEDVYGTNNEICDSIMYSTNLLKELILHDITDDAQIAVKKAESFIKSIPADGSSIEYPFSDMKSRFRLLSVEDRFNAMVQEKRKDRESIDFMQSDAFKVWTQVMK